MLLLLFSTIKCHLITIHRSILFLYKITWTTTTTTMGACFAKVDQRFNKKVHRTKSNAVDISSSSSAFNNVYIGATSSLWNSQDHAMGREQQQCEYLAYSKTYIYEFKLLTSNDHYPKSLYS